MSLYELGYIFVHFYHVFYKLQNTYLFSTLYALFTSLFTISTSKDQRNNTMTLGVKYMYIQDRNRT